MRVLILSILVFFRFGTFAMEECGSQEGYESAVYELRNLESLDGEGVIIHHNMLTFVEAYVIKLEGVEAGLDQKAIDKSVAQVCEFRD